MNQKINESHDIFDVPGQKWKSEEDCSYLVKDNM
jgi:hypothetical protein